MFNHFTVKLTTAASIKKLSSVFYAKQSQHVFNIKKTSVCSPAFWYCWRFNLHNWPH